MSLLRLLLLLLCLPGTSQKYDALACVGHRENATEWNSQINLRRLLLQRHYIDRGLPYFYNGTQGEPPDTVYGLFLCRPDIEVNECQSCIGSATTEISLSCPTQKRVMIWYDECQVLFSNQSFFTILQTTPAIKIFDNTTVTYSDVLVEVLVTWLRNVTDSTISSDESYATSRTNVRPSLEVEARAQCMPDLSKPDCKGCFSAVTDELRIFTGKQYVQIMLPSCYVRYEIHASVPSRPVTSPTNRMVDKTKGKRPVEWLISGVLAGACFISIISKLHVRKHRKDLRLLDLGNGFGGIIPGADFLGDMNMNSRDIELMQLDSIRVATDNFSDESELGKGGFGPVYKVRERDELYCNLSNQSSAEGTKKFISSV
ncbi:hypothetical protein MLD38_037182 [Melastoma candidum]|uniref:Uncharacterized protein n=1 Tax=Melastoma candidum TaxID=119954 RepID=A0ACB9LNT3_9MYRT|nr:hypothetical protein MLD38_037182 [Melastoma candidum]